MQFWEHIQNTALLGTDKSKIDSSLVPEKLVTAVKKISENTKLDNEEKFLQTLTLGCLYYYSGVKPIHSEVELSVCKEEILSYCNNKSSQALRSIILHEYYEILEIWLDHCIGSKQIIPVEYLPQILDFAKQKKSLRSKITRCCGIRGEWLSNINPDWNFIKSETEDIWNTGNTDQRKEFLKEIRHVDPKKAVELLNNTWKQENANTKADFLQVLYQNLSAEDVLWLETITGEKSQKVRDAALDLLKRIPGSSISEKYWELLKPQIQLSKEKTLGVFGKNSLKLNSTLEIPADIAKTGIDTLSPDKEYTDSEYFLFQLISWIQPSKISGYINESPAKIAELLAKDNKLKKYIKAFAISANRFKDVEWAKAIIDSSPVLYHNLISLLTEQQQDQICRSIVEKHTDVVIDLITSVPDRECSLDLARGLLKVCVEDVYKYNKNFYKRISPFLPTSLHVELQGMVITSERYQNAIDENIQYLTDVLKLKQNIIQSFQP